IAYEKNGQIYYQKMIAGVAQGSPVQVAIQGFQPTIASDGNDFLIAYQSSPVGGQLINANLVSYSSGALTINPQFTITNQGLRPALMFGAGKWMIAWQDQRLGYGTWEIFAKFMTNGTLSNEFAISALGNGHSSSCPSLTYDGHHFLITFKADSPGYVVQV